MNQDIAGEFFAASRAATEDRMAQAIPILRGENTPSTQSKGPLLFGMDIGAKYLGVSRSTLWRIVKSGKIKPVEIRPGSFKVRREDLERFAGVRS